VKTGHSIHSHILAIWPTVPNKPLSHQRWCQPAILSYLLILLCLCITVRCFKMSTATSDYICTVNYSVKWQYKIVQVQNLKGHRSKSMWNERVKEWISLDEPSRNAFFPIWLSGLVVRALDYHARIPGLNPGSGCNFWCATSPPSCDGYLYTLVVRGGNLTLTLDCSDTNTPVASEILFARRQTSEWW